MKSLETNTVVIGGGPGGYPAAIRLGQLGIDTILVEKNKVGGTCLNVGCIPSKALLNASSSYAEMEKGTNNMGITSQGAEIDWSKTIAWKDQLVGKLVGGVKGLLSANKVQLVNGFGKLLSPTQVQVENEGEEATIINCKNIIISTGSVVVNLPPFPVDNKQILDSTGLLSLTEIPKSLIILGGGVIGMEMGTVYTNLGTKVTIVEMLERILLNGEEEAANLVQREFEKKSGVVLDKTRAVKVEQTENGVELTVEKDGEQQVISAELLAVTVGRKPCIEGLNLEGLNIDLNETRRIPVNNQLQTVYPSIYAIGDVIDGPMLAHKATAEGVLAAEIIAGEKASRDDIQVIPDVIYTHPEIANAGLQEKQALEKGYDIKVGKFPLAALGRAATKNETIGYVKYIANAEDDRVIGATIVASHASDLISQAAFAIEMGATLDDIALTIHPHPSFGEAHMEAAAAGLNKAIHIVNK